MTVVALVPQQWPIIASMAVTEGVPLLAWLLAAFGIGCRVQLVAPFWPSSRKMVQQVTPYEAHSHQIVTSLALGLGLISVLTLLLGVVGALSRLTAVLLLAVGLTSAIAHIYKYRNTVAIWLHASPGASWLLLLAAPVVGVTLIGACVLPGVLWRFDDPAGYDVVAYHLQMPREWYETGRITPLQHNVFSFFPLNVEMHYLLAMHLRGGPWAGMYLAQLMHGAFVALTVVAIYGAARSRGRLAASVAAIICASVPWMPMLGSVAFNEGGLMLFTTLAAAWAIRGRWMLAGVFAGLAAGSKLTGVACAVMLVPVVIFTARAIGSLSLWERVRVRAGSAPDDSRTDAGPHPGPLPEGEGVATRVRGFLVFGLLALLVASPWLVRTAIASGGNPVFPLATRMLGSGHFDAGQVERFNVAHAPRDDQQSFSERFAALWQQVGGDYHFGSVELGIALPLWLALIVPAIALARRDREACIWLGLIAGNVVVWLLATHLQGRFLVQIIPCVAMLVSCAIRPMAGAELRRGGIAFAAIAVSIAVVSFGFSMRKPIATLLSPISLASIGVSTSDELRQLLPDDLAAAVYDTDRPIVLVGDAKAFWYAIPSERLRYRSVFDVRSAISFRDAWLGDDVPPDALVIVQPSELARFGRTYRNLPAVPEAWRDRGEAFVVRAADVPQ